MHVLLFVLWDFICFAFLLLFVATQFPIYFLLRDDVMLHDNGGCMHTFNESQNS